MNSIEEYFRYQVWMIKIGLVAAAIVVLWFVVQVIAAWVRTLQLRARCRSASKDPADYEPYDRVEVDDGGRGKVFMVKSDGCEIDVTMLYGSVMRFYPFGRFRKL